ncbi:fasciclin domain-containing protein [Spirosoma radiotolerans]|uniref:Beta-Ig-H3/fasciclin n=1 Tax=Spirosoma radiotolerans TaxID=1379870 RepID=A0A0E3ZU29_9BACT|nr:fasciclin domain-containing protein [Spirosoma radiotolerans]AKD54928.1 beta-Ig-H3/fasciclin [Spirosoma radiotolerans]
MKINHPLSLLALGTTLLATPSWSQTTPTGTATSTTYPQGAITTDSTSAKSSREQKRAMKRNRKMTNQASNNVGTTTNTSPQDANYRKSSASVGTAVNNSNTTNYNSNNVTNAPTGAGSNPNAMTAPTPADQVSNGQSNSAARSSSSSAGSAYSPNTGATDSNAGAAEAVSGMKNSKEPAVKAGSTVRNTSIGDFVSSSPNYVTLQNALQTADMWETLKGGGPYTLFAPTNAAFKKLSSAAQGALLDGSNRAALKQLLAYHVVSGMLSTDELSKQVKAGNGKAQLKTLSGATLTIQESNGHLTLTDEQGNTATVDGMDNRQSNGVVYGITSVLMPKSGVDAFR